MTSSVIKFDHLERMTDDTGLLEHSLGRIPRRREGYSTDDNARAIWACLEWLALLKNREMEKRLYRLLDRYLAFLLWAQNDDGTFHNNFFFDRTKEEETPSDDCLGRSFWAVASAYIQLNDPARCEAAADMLRRGMPAAWKLHSLRGIAWGLAACGLLLEKASPPGVDKEELATLAGRFERRLLEAYWTHTDDGWRWYEPELTYGNGVLPWALWTAYRRAPRQEVREVAEESLAFLIEMMSGPEGTIRPVGNRGWCSRRYRADWDQQPIDVMKLALAAREAYWATEDGRYRDVVRRCLAWFYGKNDGNVPLADRSDGSCCDGLGPNGPNPNRGAESTLSYLLTAAIAQSISVEVVFDEYVDNETVRMANTRI
ncbi:glycosyl transferase [Geobacillus thermodenitrificans]|uniref:glycosyl transferase n=1 Tax=Geobacillus TaxID=129337 RepID=UPI000C05BED3|nr:MULTISPECIES: glycosyl transferase [Geobacillus]ATO37175.1 glycosyl transferase [Geobacillus thermodenitrificans]QNU30197.1 glycosyl transferase [Geobacillus sp. 47C-IIb]